jgi:hypothetical protein
MRPLAPAFLVGILFWLWATQVAWAYTIATPLTPGCHERLTAQALRAVRADPALAAAAAPRATRSDDAEALVDDLPFRLDDDLHDLEAAALLIGVRDNDLKGLDAADLAALPGVHSDPTGQREHTLRRPEQDEPQGSAAAVSEARDYVDNAVLYALERGLGDDGRPDPDKRTRVNLFLSLRGAVKPDLPLFWIYLGQALHALQDSYSHSYRTADGQRITVALNWVDFAQDEFLETRDGPAHAQKLDQCEDLDDLRRGRWNLAAAASEQLLRAALTPGASVSQRHALVAAVLDAHMTFAPGCNADNRWCDAAERAYADPGACSCQLGRAAQSGGGPAVVAAVALGLVVAIKARRRRRCRSAPAIWAGLLLLTALTTSSAADAAPVAACVPGQQISCGCPAGLLGVQICRADGAGYDACGSCAPAASAAPAAPTPRRENLLPPPPPTHGSRLAVSSWTGAALDRTALVAGVGIRYHLDDAWMTGVGIEWNPWASLDARRIRAGSLNLAVSLIRRYQVTPRLSLRTSLHLGGSVLLFGLYGAPAGSVGPYGALSWMGLEIEISPRWRLILDPMEVAVPIPQLRGVPLVYRQYRFVVGVQLGD